MLFNQGDDVLINELTSSLRSKTIECWNAKMPLTVKTYSPWICCFPIWKTVGKNLESVFSQVYQSSKLLTSKAFLVSLETFFEEQGLILANDLTENSRFDFKLFTDISKDGKKEIIFFNKSLDLVFTSSSHLKSLWINTIDLVIPLNINGRVGMSTDLARGAIFTSFSNRKTLFDFAIDLVHELGHQVLMIFNSADKLFTEGANKLVYSGIRLKERPAIQSYHSSIALGFMLYFANSYLSQINGKLENEFHYAQEKIELFEKQLKLNIDALKENCSFTILGNRLLSDLENLYLPNTT